MQNGTAVLMLACVVLVELVNLRVVSFTSQVFSGQQLVLFTSAACPGGEASKKNINASKKI